MEGILKVVQRSSKMINVIAEVTLTLIMLLTVADVILRSFKKPIIGTYELVSFSGAVVIGFSVPLTSWMRGHVSVDIITSRFSKKVRDIFNIATRCLVIGLFLLIGSNLIKYGMDLHKAKEVSMTLEIPFYPVAYGVGICCFVQCLVMFCDIVKISGGSYE
jgi:TRAP-type C4-dicarboxylate transport system permease small subunit